MNYSKLKTLVYLLVAGFILSSCSSIDIFKENVETPVNTPYESFVIMNKEVGVNGFNSQFVDQQVQIHIEEALQNRGMSYDKLKPELVIRYTSNEDKRQREINNNYNPYPFWGYRVWNPWMYSPYGPNFNNNSRSSSSYELLQVIVDFIDPKEDKLLMTLTGVTEVSNPKHKSKKVLATTDKIISFFLDELENARK
ncbi:DUF4136 domain-containing protein [Algoriphagus halophytocola]|uniref:DUF4136 domain-containing protein n=1 Tax=Algoriphagus halophytocola TaxID=2991499 RepID=UPI0022DCFEC1|nr:DUF4136 domain-containing protein [Algoriphagus sp. TR-M9]WBL44696.1 DUF4136 domain-containing protein [Algoriphagus sp. TR-M9]